MRRGARLLLAALLGTGIAGGAMAQRRPPAAAPAAAAEPEQPSVLRLESVVPLRGPPGPWGKPKVDEASRRIYLPRGPAGLLVLSLDGFKTIGEVAETAGSAAVALDSTTLRGFSANGYGATQEDGAKAAGGVVAFDQRTLKVLGRVEVPAPVLVLHDVATRQLVVVGSDGVLSLVDPVKLAIGKTLDLGGKQPTAIASDRRGRLFVALADRDAIAVVDLVSAKLSATWKLGRCRAPAALLFESRTFRIVVGCRGAVAAPDQRAAGPTGALLDGFSGQLLAGFVVPAEVDDALFDAPNRMLYFTSGSTATAISYRQIDFNRYLPQAAVGTRPLAGRGAVDGRTGRLLLPAAEYAALPDRPMEPGSGGVRILGNSAYLLVMKRLPLD